MIGRGAAADPASSHAGTEESLRRALRLQPDDALDRGTAIHTLLEGIEWLEEWRADQSEMVRQVRAAIPRRDEAWALEQVETLMEIIDRPKVKDLLSRGTASPTSREVHRELPFVRLVNGRVQSGYIDRLVTEIDTEGHAHRATIIDFKTDDIDASAAAEHAETYRGQLETYRTAAARVPTRECACRPRRKTRRCPGG